MNMSKTMTHKQIDPYHAFPRLQLLRENTFEQAFKFQEVLEPAQLALLGAYTKPCVPPNPQLLAYSRDCAAMLGLNQIELTSDSFLQLMSGQGVLQGLPSYAMNYGGHQFGQWAGQLGDGRALNLCEVQTHKGPMALQLKGAGPTPFSRRGDGFAVLRSSIREFLCSEAMHALGVPTSRALSLVDRGETVIRDVFYDGRPQAEPSAVVCRVAPSFLRFGHFELLARRGDFSRLNALLRFTLSRYFPELGVSDVSASELDAKPLPAEIIHGFFSLVCDKTAALFAHWQSLGFTHGVLNTDNMSIHGITLDYGPFGWLESYDPRWTPNTTDAQLKRYAFAQQPKTALWNLWQLGNALAQVCDADGLSARLSTFQDQYSKEYQQRMSAKFGLQEIPTDFLKQMEAVFAEEEVDMTVFFRGLSQIVLVLDANAAHENAQQLNETALHQHLLCSSYGAKVISETSASRLFVKEIIKQWSLQHRSSGQSAQERAIALNLVNPKYVPRNYMLYKAIEAATAGDFSQVQWLHGLFQKPFEDQGQDALTQMRPAWAQTQPGCSALSCSS